MFKTIATPHNAATLERNRELVEHVLTALLPTGSGIDCKWSFDWYENGSVKASNSWHAMNDSGFYIGWADFSITVNTFQPLEAFRLQFHGDRSQKLARRLMLRDYLTDTIYEAFPNASQVNLLYWFNQYRAGLDMTVSDANGKAIVAAIDAIKSFKE